MRHLLTVLVLGSVAWASPPVVTVPAEVAGEVGGFVPVRATVAGSKVVKFVPLDGGLNVFPADLLADKTATVVTSGKAGRYRILCYSGNADGPSDAVTVTVVIGGAAPIVDPVKPDVVKAEKLAVVVVEESATRTVKQAEQLTSLRKWIDAGGHTLFLVDKDDPAAVRNGYLPYARDLPAVLVFDQKAAGKPLSVVKLDADTVTKVKEVVK